MMLFLDADAIAARYLESRQSLAVRTILGQEQEEGCAISSITVPAFSALLAALREDGVPEADLERALEAFHADLPDLVQIPVDASLPRVGQLAVRHRMSVASAIQLAAARILEDRLQFRLPGFPTPLVKVVTFDECLAEAAGREGLAVAP